MQTSYIYSVSRVNALEQFLLSKADIERLLVVEPGEDIHSVLKETYLAPYVAHVPDENVELAIEQTLIDAKRMLHRIAPKGDMFRVLWVQYDIHNLRVFAKATAKQMSYDECKPFLSERGIYDSAYLHTKVEGGTLDHLQPDWQAAYSQALGIVAAGDIHKVDGVFDGLYFSTCQQIVNTVGDIFMRNYFRVMIDMYNLKSRVRHLNNKTVTFAPVFVPEGTFGTEQIETIEDVFDTFARFGGADFWKDALENFQATGNTARINARAAEYLLTFAKEASRDMFSSASLVFYYLKCRQAAANIRTIVVGKNSGKSEQDIRANLRMAYVNN